MSDSEHLPPLAEIYRANSTKRSTATKVYDQALEQFIKENISKIFDADYRPIIEDKANAGQVTCLITLSMPNRSDSFVYVELRYNYLVWKALEAYLQEEGFEVSSEKPIGQHEVKMRVSWQRPPKPPVQEPPSE